MSLSLRSPMSCVQFATPFAVGAALLLTLASCEESSRSARRPFAAPPAQRRIADASLPPETEEKVEFRVINGQEVRSASDLAAATAAAVDSARSENDKTLDGTRLDTLELDDMPLERVAWLLTKTIGTNVVVSAEAKAKRVTLYLHNVSARAAIEGVCRLNNLWYREDREMIRILTAEEYGKELVIRRDEQTQLYYLKNASAPAVAAMIASLMPDQVDYRRPEEETSYGHVGTDGDDPMSNSNSTTNSSTSNRTSSTSTSWDGTTTSSTVRRTTTQSSSADVNSAYQRGILEGMNSASADRLARSLKEGGGRLSEETLAREAGSAPTASVVLSVFLRNNCIGVRTAQESMHHEIGRLIEALDTATRQVLLEVKILKITLGNGFESFFNLAYSGNGRIGTATAADLSGTSTPAVTFNYLDNHVSAAMKMLKDDNRLQVVATPMLLCANNAPAEFFSGVTRMIITNYEYSETTTSEGATTFTVVPQTSERSIGTDVQIRPSINADGTVTLRFLLEIGNVNVGGGNVYLAVNGQTQKLPIDTVDNERTESIVVGKHGQAIVMGGLVTETVTKARSYVPLVGDLPMLGKLLSNSNNDSRTRSETVILIVPHILGAANQGQTSSEIILKNNSQHPWVKEDRKNLTDWDPKNGRLRETAPPMAPVDEILPGLPDKP